MIPKSCICYYFFYNQVCYWTWLVYKGRLLASCYQNLSMHGVLFPVYIKKKNWVGMLTIVQLSGHIHFEFYGSFWTFHFPTYDTYRVKLDFVFYLCLLNRGLSCILLVYLCFAHFNNEFLIKKKMSETVLYKWI